MVELNPRAVRIFVGEIGGATHFNLANAITTNMLPVIREQYAELQNEEDLLPHQIGSFDQNSDGILTDNEVYDLLLAYFTYLADKTSDSETSYYWMIQMFNESFLDENGDDDHTSLHQIIVPNCMICFDPLNTIDGPGISRNCRYDCNDVIVTCRNNHLFHRGCILELCNTSTIDIGNDNSTQVPTVCPACRSPLTPQCSGLAHVSGVNRSEIGEDGRRLTHGGRKRKARKSARRKRYSKRRRGSYRHRRR